MKNTGKRPQNNGAKRRKRPDQSKFRKRGKGGAQHSRLPKEDRQYRKAEPMSPIEMEGVFNSLIPEAQHAISAAGYATPTPVQAKAIPPQIEGKDLLGSAQTGTGKTAAFTLPLLQKLSAETTRAESRHPRALILAPTRELAAQIGESIQAYGRFLQVTHTVIFGGVGQFPQQRAMNNGVDIVVATPGRLLDLMEQGYVKLGAINTFVLDEADRMLDMGFIPDIKRIIAKLPRQRQTAFFSATLGSEIISLAKSILIDPVHIRINPEQPTVEKIHQQAFFVDRDHKCDLLISMLSEPEVERVIVFTRMKYVADRVCKRLKSAGINAAPIHGNRTQAARTKALDGFRKGRVKVLVATDIAARGIDVDNISHVINFDIPHEPQNYIHRIGRTARAGSYGQAWSFCSAEERQQLNDIERLIKKRIPANMDHEFHSNKALNGGKASARSGRGKGRPFQSSRRSRPGRGRAANPKRRRRAQVVA